MYVKDMMGITTLPVGDVEVDILKQNKLKGHNTSNFRWTILSLGGPTILKKETPLLLNTSNAKDFVIPTLWLFYTGMYVAN